MYRWDAHSPIVVLSNLYLDLNNATHQIKAEQFNVVECHFQIVTLCHII